MGEMPRSDGLGVGNANHVPTRSRASTHATLPNLPQTRQQEKNWVLQLLPLLLPPLAQWKAQLLEPGGQEHGEHQALLPPAEEEEIRWEKE